MWAQLERLRCLRGAVSEAELLSKASGGGGVGKARGGGGKAGRRAGAAAAAAAAGPEASGGAPEASAGGASRSLSFSRSEQPRDGDGAAAAAARPKLRKLRGTREEVEDQMGAFIKASYPPAPACAHPPCRQPRPGPSYLLRHSPSSRLPSPDAPQTQQARERLWEDILLMRPVDEDDVLDAFAAAGVQAGRGALGAYLAREGVAAVHTRERNERAQRAPGGERRHF